MELHFKRTAYSNFYEKMFFRQEHKLKKIKDDMTKRLCLYYNEREAADRQIKKILFQGSSSFIEKSFICAWIYCNMGG